MPRLITTEPAALSVEQLRRQLGIDRDYALNVWCLLELAHLRGRHGRWPEQRFLDDLEWPDGMLLDEVARQAGIDSEPVFELYRRAHARGLAHGLIESRNARA